MKPLNTTSAIFHEMMKPKLLHHYLSWSLPDKTFKIFVTMSALRAEMLSPTFLHSQHEQNHENLKSYWSNQIHLAKKATPALLHPLLQALVKHTVSSDELLLPCLKTLEGFVYEIDTQWSLFALPMQRNRLIHNLSKLWELLLPKADVSSFTLALNLKDIQWCQKVAFYQYRGLFVSLFDIDPMIFESMREEIYAHTPLKSYHCLSYKVFIKYYVFIANLLKNEGFDSCSEYSKPSYIGIAKFLCSLVF